MRVIIAFRMKLSESLWFAQREKERDRRIHTALGFHARLAPSVLQVSGLKRLILLSWSEEQKGELEGGSAAGDHTAASVTSGCTSCPLSLLCLGGAVWRVWCPAFFFCFPSADWFLSLGPFTLRSHLSYKCDWLKLTNNYTWQIIVLCANLLWAIKKDASNKSRDEKDTCSFVLVLVIGWPGGKKVSACPLIWPDFWQTKHMVRPTSYIKNPETLQSRNPELTY